MYVQANKELKIAAISWSRTITSQLFHDQYEKYFTGYLDCFASHIVLGKTTDVYNLLRILYLNLVIYASFDAHAKWRVFANK